MPGWLEALIALLIKAWRSAKPQPVQEGEDLGRAQASLDVITQGQTAAAAEAQATAQAPRDAFGVMDELDKGTF